MGDTTPSIAAQVVALTKLSVPELRQKWQDVFGEPTTQQHRQYLIRRIAWRLQSDAYGGLSEEAQARLHELQEEFRTSPPETWFKGARHNRATTPPTPKRPAPVRDAKAPKPGTILTRTYRGTKIIVTVRGDREFEWRGDIYRSLSAVAKAVTGSHCSGIAFFGLARKGGGK